MNEQMNKRERRAEERGGEERRREEGGGGERGSKSGSERGREEEEGGDTRRDETRRDDRVCVTLDDGMFVLVVNSITQLYNKEKGTTTASVTKTLRATAICLSRIGTCEATPLLRRSGQRHDLSSASVRCIQQLQIVLVIKAARHFAADYRAWHRC